MTDLHTAARKLALEALGDFADAIRYDNEHDDIGSRVCCGALSYNPHTNDCKAMKSITALQQALEQPAQQEPVAYMGTDIEGNPNKFRLNPFGGCVPLYKKPPSVKVWDAEGYDALCQQLEGWKTRALKAEQPAQQEPVAVVVDPYDTPGIQWLCQHPPKRGEPLYTSPPAQRKPLSKGEIYTAYITATNQTLRPQDERLAFAFARAIEAAHNIKENT